MGFLKRIFTPKRVAHASAEQLIREFAGVLAEAEAEFTSIELLPVSKDRLDLAFREVLASQLDEDARSNIEVCYLSLADFQELSDEQVLALNSWDIASKMRSQEMSRDQITAMARVIASAGQHMHDLREKAERERQTYFAVAEGIRAAC